MLFSLYVSILVTTLSAVVPNYYTLLLARALIGVCVGLNSSTINVYFAENVSSKEVYKFGTLTSDLVFAAGGGWVAILAFLILRRCGWRIFVVCTSLPVFLPPIFLLHFYFKHDDVLYKPLIIENTNGELETKTEDIPYVQNQKCRVAKASMMKLINTLQGYGTIMLLPSFIRADNKGVAATDASCNAVIHGTQFLLLALVTGGTNFVGRSVGYALQQRVKFIKLQPVLSVILATCYIVIIFNNNLVTAVVALAVAKFTYAMMVTKINLIMFDKSFLGAENFAANCGIIFFCGMIGAVTGNSLAAFYKPAVAVITTGVLSWIQVFVVISVREVE